jgi:hypothetical protein
LKEAFQAFLLSALAAVVLSLISVTALTWNSTEIRFVLSDLRFLFFLLLTLLILAVAGLALVAVPGTLLLSRLNAERAWVYPTFGFLTGFGIALIGYSEPPLRGSDWAELALAAGLPGALAGQVWWTKYPRIASAGQRA